MNTIKNYFKDWTVFEKVWIMAFTFINIYLFFALKDTVIGLVTSLTGMLCVVLTAKGKISNYYFGVINVALYAFIAYGQKYYGEAILNAVYFFPMNFVGIYLWSKHKVKADTVKIERMTLKSRIIWSVITVVTTLVYGFVLGRMGSELPYMNALTTAVSVIAMILTTKRYFEQWILWIVVDIATVAMWAVAFINGGNDVSMLVMWSAYLVNAVYGLVNWIKMYEVQGKLVSGN